MKSHASLWQSFVQLEFEYGIFFLFCLKIETFPGYLLRNINMLKVTSLHQNAHHWLDNVKYFPRSPTSYQWIMS